MAVVSYTIGTEPLIVNGVKLAGGASVTRATAEPMALVDLERVAEVDTGDDWLTPVSE